MNAVSAITHDPVDRLAEDFLARYRRGERPSVTDYARQFPDVADQVADLIQVLLLMEKLGEEQIGAENPADGPLPEQLGEFRIVREIGRGGMGVVYEAHQGELGRRVALKVLPAIALLRPTHLARFHREAQAAARLHHTNVVPVFGVGVQDGIYYYAMQRIEGRGLDAVLRELLEPAAAGSGAGETPRDLLGKTPRSGTASSARRPDDALAIARIGFEIADALAHAHTQGVIHRDVKPSNILLDADGRAWLSDFGLAQFDAGEAVTGSGELVGTLRYMAPERFRGAGDARGDIYSLGLTLYELLTRRPAFAESERARLIHQILTEDPVAPRRLRPAIPRDLETIILKAITKEPDQRYQTAKEFADDLDRFLADRPVTARRLGVSERTARWVRRNAAFSAAAALAFLTLLAGLAATFWQWRRAEWEGNEHQLAANAAVEARGQAEASAALAWRSLREILDGINKASSESLPDVRRRLFEHALRLHEEYLATLNAPPRPLELASVATELGMLHMNAGNLKSARAVLGKAVTILHSVPDPASPTALADLGLAEAYLARTFESDDPPSSLIHAQNSLDALHAARSVNPSNTQALVGLIFALDVHSLAQRRLGGEWEKDLREAIPLIDQLEARHIHGNLAAGTVIRCLRNYATALLQHQREDEALPLAERAYHLAAQLASRNPDVVTTQELFPTCSAAYAAILAKKNDLPHSEQLFRRNIETYRALLKNNPENARLHSGLGGDLNNLAIVLGKRNQTREALNLVREAITEQQSARERYPTHKEYAEFLYNHFKTQTRLLLQNHDHIQAAVAARQLATLLKPNGQNQFEAALYLCQAANQAAQDDKLSESERDQEVKRTCDQAMNHLRTAVRRGYSNRAVLQQSPFHVLHGRDDYRQLLSHVPAASAKSQ